MRYGETSKSSIHNLKTEIQLFTWTPLALKTTFCWTINPTNHLISILKNRNRQWLEKNILWRIIVLAKIDSTPRGRMSYGADDAERVSAHRKEESFFSFSEWKNDAWLTKNYQLQYTTLNNKNRLANAASHDTEAYQEDDGETVSFRSASTFTSFSVQMSYTISQLKLCSRVSRIIKIDCST